jgi:hypothetical protein
VTAAWRHASAGLSRIPLFAAEWNSPAARISFMTAQPAPAFTLSSDLPAPELTDDEFMAALASELKRASILSEMQIQMYLEDRKAWLDYKADGYSPREAVESDMEYWD